MNHENTPLTQARINEMRAHVMSRINTNQRRSNRWIPITIAAAVITVFGSAGIGYLAGNHTGGQAMVTSQSTMDSAPELTAQDASGNLFRTHGQASDFSASSEQASLERATGTSDPEHIIVTGSVSVTVKNATSTHQKIRGQVVKLNGWLDADSTSNHGETSINMTVRIPSGSVEEFSGFLAGIGTVTDTSIHRAQVDQQVRDLDARIEALKVSTKRLQTIMTEATKTSDLLEAEARLAERQAELEGLQAQRKGLADRTAMATIDVFVSTRTPADAVNPGGFRGGLVSGWNAFVSLLNLSVMGFGFLLPWILPMVIVGFGIRWLIRRRR